jgi:hypothetical protein
LLYENVRYEPKSFRQRCFESGRPIWNLQGVRRVPYRLPDLIEKIRYGCDVWLCEGEKDADALAELGLTATSFKNWTRDFNKYLKKTNVVIVRDHDVPGGMQANEAARLASEVAETVKVLDVFEELEMREKHGPDVSDYIRACVQDEGMTNDEIVERLSIMADGCSRWVDDKEMAEANLFVTKSGNEWLDEAAKRPSPKMLFGEFWFQGELCILFADTNVGKSILAVQIGDAISRGAAGFQQSAVSGQQETDLPAECRMLKAECPPQRVVYFDFELTDKQFEARLSDKLPGADHYTNHHRFTENFRRSELDPETDDLHGFHTFEEFLNSSLDKTIRKEKADVLIIDNLTYLRDETENARNALPLMKYLKELKKRHGISILALAHTPKRDSSKPLGRNDLQGSKMLINFCDSSFAIGESQKEQGVRYLKQIKSRNSAIIYHAENVLLGNIVKKGSLLQFEFLGTGCEREHLRTASEKDRSALIARVKELSAEGKSQREVAEAIGVSVGSVNRYLKEA